MVKIQMYVTCSVKVKIALRLARHAVYIRIYTSLNDDGRSDGNITTYVQSAVHFKEPGMPSSIEVKAARSYNGLWTGMVSLWFVVHMLFKHR